MVNWEAMEMTGACLAEEGGAEFWAAVEGAPVARGLAAAVFVAMADSEAAGAGAESSEAVPEAARQTGC